jgi:signal transduction histidine kinase
MASERTNGRTIDKKRTVILLRSVVVISTSYLILFGGTASSPASVTYILALIVSNLLLALTPKDWFQEPRFSAALLLGDTAVVLIGLYLTVGCFSQDFLIIYFFTIFLTTATESVGQIAVGAAMISGLYGYWLWLTSVQALGAAEWLRLPFFFIVAVFYAYVTEETKQERWRRQQAERESERLRFLFEVSETFSQRAVNEQLVRQLGGLIEAAFPRLACEVDTDSADPTARPGAAFHIQTHDRSFGVLRVAPNSGSDLSPDEHQFCRVAAMITANALYTAQQARVAQEGTRVKQEFLSTLSHELRSPLHVILGNAEIIADETQQTVSPFVRESIDRLRTSAYRLLDIVEELLCFTELRAGHTAIYIERVDLRDLFDEFATGVKELLVGRPIRFECNLGADVPALFTDRRKLRLIVNGLLGNAAKFTESGFVRLSARCVAGDAIEIAVQDSGIGIEAKDLPQIFDEFYQADGSLRRRFDGLGLGLALTRELATALGGRVEAESQPTCGSTFRVRLPLRSGSESPHAATRAAPLAVALQSSRLLGAA